MIQEPLYVCEVLNILSNIDTVNILCTLHNNAMTFMELSDETGIPKLTLYSKLKLLVNKGLVSKMTGTSLTLYKLNIKSLFINIADELTVFIITKDGKRYIDIDEQMVAI